MSKSWENFGEQAMESPKSTLKAFIKISIVVILLSFAFSGVGYIAGWFGSAATVAKQEFSPKAMLTKYEWFKDASASLDKKKADILIYQSNLALFEGMNRKDMDRTDKQQQAQWTSEVAGVRASYNSLAADWNSQMSKFHWSPFLGDLPLGAEELLTKDYAPYEL